MVTQEKAEKVKEAQAAPREDVLHSYTLYRGLIERHCRIELLEALQKYPDDVCEDALAEVIGSFDAQRIIRLANEILEQP